MNKDEKIYHRHLRAVIKESIEAAGGCTAVARQCGMLPHSLIVLGKSHLPSLRVMLRVAVTCGTTPAAWLAEAERRILEHSYQRKPKADEPDDFSMFDGRAGFDVGL